MLMHQRSIAESLSQLHPRFPRMGVNRDLKKATEAFWGGKLSKEELLSEGKRLRLEHWQIQKKAGVDIIPSNDFAFYDQVLDHIHLFGVSLLLLDDRKKFLLTWLKAVPERYSKYNLSALEEYFAMGRGLQRPAKDGQEAVDVPALVISIRTQSPVPQKLTCSRKW